MRTHLVLGLGELLIANVPDPSQTVPRPGTQRVAWVQDLFEADLAVVMDLDWAVYAVTLELVDDLAKVPELAGEDLSYSLPLEVKGPLLVGTKAIEAIAHEDLVQAAHEWPVGRYKVQFAKEVQEQKAGWSTYAFFLPMGLAAILFVAMGLMLAKDVSPAPAYLGMLGCAAVCLLAGWFEERSKNEPPPGRVRVFLQPDEGGRTQAID